MNTKKSLSRKKKLNVNREYKDRLFKFIFGNPVHKDWLLSLFNAVNGSSYTDPEAIKITTLEDVIYMNMKNDVSFLIADTMNFYEAQSTYNLNMPMRFLIYAGMVYSAYAVNAEPRINMYSLKQQRFPAPRLVCFYNGKDEYEDVTELHLQDAFPKDTKSDIAITVRMINVNYGKNKDLLNACLPLRDYSLFVHGMRQIRAQNPKMMMKRVVGLAIDTLPEDSLIKPFLLEHKAEVTKMCITEYDEARTMALFKEEGREEGLEEGLEKGREEGLEKGREEANAKFSLLLQKLIAQGKNDDIQRISVDKEYREQLYEEYGLNELNAA